MIREGDHYWVDHVTVTGNKSNDGITIGQGSKGDSSSSEVTISNYKTYNTTYAVLGGGENEIVNYPPYRVTIHSSSLGASDRNPKIKNFGTAHVFNNHIHSFQFSGITAGANSQVLSENNVFSAENANNPDSTVIGHTKNGGVSGVTYSNNDLYLDSAGWRGDVRFGSQESFPIPYTYTLKDVNEVVRDVLANAGAEGVNYENSASCQTYTQSYTHLQ